jgi:HSP90 family molecular chaperone
VELTCSSNLSQEHHMQLNIVGGSSSTQQTRSTNAVASTALSQALDAAVPADQDSQSGPAALFKKLEALAKSDPAKFKQVTAEMATKVKEAADTATDPHEKKMLTELSQKFTDASTSGDASGLKPPEGGRPPGGPPPGGKAGKGGAGGAAEQKQYAAADANKDGTVTLAEQAAYDAQQQSRAEKAYTQTMDQAKHGRAEALFASLDQVLSAA